MTVSMSKKKKKPMVVSAALKAKILSESYKPGCVISELARSYGLSASRVYGWRSDCNKYPVGHQTSLDKQNPSSCEQSKFVELTLDEESPKSLVTELPISTPGSLELKKAILIFDSFSLTIEGSFSHDTMLNILKIGA